MSDASIQQKHPTDPLSVKKKKKKRRNSMSLVRTPVKHQVDSKPKGSAKKAKVVVENYCA